MRFDTMEEKDPLDGWRNDMKAYRIDENDECVYFVIDEVILSNTGVCLRKRGGPIDDAPVDAGFCFKTEEEAVLNRIGELEAKIADLKSSLAIDKDKDDEEIE